MTVESLRRYLHSLSNPAGDGRATHLNAGDARALASGLAPFEAMTVDSLVKLIKSASTAAVKYEKELAKEAEKAEKAKAKRVAKEAADSLKRDKAEAAKREKAQAKDQAKREAEEAGNAAAQQTGRELKAILTRINHELVEAPELDAVLAKLKPFTQTQLLSVASMIGYDDVPYDGATKAKILKSLTDRIKRVWRTSHRVRQ